MNYEFQRREWRKDTIRKKLSGVCAGLARYWDQPAWLIRTGALLALLIFPVPTAMAYLLAVLLLPTDFSR